MIFSSVSLLVFTLFQTSLKIEELQSSPMKTVAPLYLESLKQSLEPFVNTEVFHVILKMANNIRI